MSNCNDFIESIYVHPDINNLIAKIHPESIRDDLRQEIAVSLLEMPCERVASLFAENNLLKYAIKTCWLMATSTNSQFYYRYKKKDLLKAIQYMELMQPCKTIPITKAVEVLNGKTQTKEDDHEARVFKMFVELGSARAVSRYYNIPVNHVCNVVNKVRAELKKVLCG